MAAKWTKKDIVLIVAFPVVFGIGGALLPPVLMALQFIWDWFVSDGVIASGNLDMSTRTATRPLEGFFSGFAYACVLLALGAIVNWFAD